MSVPRRVIYQIRLTLVGAIPLNFFYTLQESIFLSGCFFLRRVCSFVFRTRAE